MPSHLGCNVCHLILQKQCCTITCSCFGDPPQTQQTLHTIPKHKRHMQLLLPIYLWLVLPVQNLLQAPILTLSPQLLGILELHSLTVNAMHTNIWTFVKT